MTRVYPMGALPPPGTEWQMGKTAASISFVNDTQRFIVQNPQHQGIKQLQEAIANVKSGTLVLSEWTTAEQYLEANKKT